MAIRILSAESFGNDARESILLKYDLENGSPIMAIIEEVIDISEESANGFEAFEAILSGVSSDNAATIST